MFTINNAAQAKKSAAALKRALAPKGLELKRSEAYEVLAQVAGYADWNAMAAALGSTQASASQTPASPLAKEAASVPSIFDVPFDKATSISVDGEHFDIRALVDEVMVWFPKWDDPANPYRTDVYQTALLLQYEDEGLIYDKDLSVNSLLTAKWDAKKEAFVSGEGEVIRVFFRVQFGKPLEAPTTPALTVPDGYRVYRTLVGTWRWSLGEFYGPGPKVDGTNLPTREDAVKEAIAHAEARQAVEAFQKLHAEAQANGLNDDPLFKLSDEIKQEYLDSGCSRKDANVAINRLLNECGELFSDGDQAWEFLMEEPHENRESDA